MEVTEIVQTVFFFILMVYILWSQFVITRQKEKIEELRTDYTQEVTEVLDQIKETPVEPKKEIEEDRIDPKLLGLSKDQMKSVNPEPEKNNRPLKSYRFNIKEGKYERIS